MWLAFWVLKRKDVKIDCRKCVKHNASRRLEASKRRTRKEEEEKEEKGGWMRDEMRWMGRREEEKKPELEEETEREAKNLGLGPIGRSKSLTSNYT